MQAKSAERDSLIIRSRAMRAVDRTIRVVAPRDVPVMFAGESGTGKEVLARYLHELSSRRSGPFVPINCAAIPESLFESELFGHERGAFTGANELALGKVEAAHRGILFLDEVGEMPLSVQAKLLRFLENHQFMRVGGNVHISVDIRIVAASSKPLEEEVCARRFRDDLFYRLQGISIPVPPLRERQDDIKPLLVALTKRSAIRHRLPPPRFTREVLATLLHHGWPGNVRELANVLDVLVVLRSGRVARLADLPASLRQPRSRSHPEPASDSVQIPLDAPLRDSVDRIVRAALDLEGQDQGRAAKRLNISVRTIQRYLARRPV